MAKLTYAPICRIPFVCGRIHDAGRFRLVTETRYHKPTLHYFERRELEDTKEQYWAKVALSQHSEEDATDFFVWWLSNKENL